MLLSIVVPCYNEEDVIDIFFYEISKILCQIKEERGIDSEIIFINDGSTDKTLNAIKRCKTDDSRIKYRSFSRNFGKEAAILAGLEVAKGNYVALMDVDLQDPPNLLIKMLDLLLDDKYDFVGTRRVNRTGEPPIRSWFARRFYALINLISDTKLVEGARDYRMMKKQVVEAILEVGEYNRFSKGIFSWVGFEGCWLEYENKQRISGNTKWSFWKLFSYSIDGIAAFSTKPLVISTVFGFILFFVSILFSAFYGIKAIVWGDPVSGFPTLICSVLFIGGIQLLCLGILGQYLSRLYLEAKHRPIFIIKDEAIE